MPIRATAAASTRSDSNQLLPHRLEQFRLTRRPIARDLYRAAEREHSRDAVQRQKVTAELALDLLGTNVVQKTE